MMRGENGPKSCSGSGFVGSLPDQCLAPITKGLGGIPIREIVLTYQPSSHLYIQHSFTSSYTRRSSSPEPSISSKDPNGASSQASRVPQKPHSHNTRCSLATSHKHFTAHQQPCSIPRCYGRRQKSTQSITRLAPFPSSMSLTCMAESSSSLGSVSLLPFGPGTPFHHS